MFRSAGVVRRTGPLAGGRPRPRASTPVPELDVLHRAGMPDLVFRASQEHSDVERCVEVITPRPGRGRYPSRFDVVEPVADVEAVMWVRDLRGEAELPAELSHGCPQRKGAADRGRV